MTLHCVQDRHCLVTQAALKRRWRRAALLCAGEVLAVCKHVAQDKLNCFVMHPWRSRPSLSDPGRVQQHCDTPCTGVCLQAELCSNLHCHSAG